MGGNKRLFYYHLIATYCHVLQKTAFFGRSRGVLGAKRLKILSKNTCFLFNFLYFSMIFIEKPPTMQQKLRPDVAFPTSRCSNRRVPT